MSIESDIFKRFTLDKNKLANYGFSINKNVCKFEKNFLDNDFKAIININGNEVTGTVIDLENNEEYIPLRIENNEGAFVGKVRDEYIKILTDIRNKCFIENYFTSTQGNRITKLIYKTYGNKPEFLWKDTPYCGIFRNQETNKWYGIIMQIKRSKLGETSNDEVEIMNVKLNKNIIPELHKKNGYYPAYHMNKKYWITILLDETLSDKEIMNRIKESHSFTKKHKKSN